MTDPTLEFRKGSSPFETLTSLNFGSIPAGTGGSPAEDPISIWNAKGNNPDVVEMSDVKIWVKDADGGSTTDLVNDQWIEVKSDGAGKGSNQPNDPVDDAESAYTNIGGDSYHGIGNLAYDQYRLLHFNMDVPGGESGVKDFKVVISFQIS